MPELVIIFLLLAFLNYYLVFLRSIREGLNSLKRPSASAKPFVSVVVAARNEETNILRCVNALSNQTYAANLFEIIIVDDHSSDDTVRMATHQAGLVASPTISVISLKNLSGKPAAVAEGISASAGQIILCTDADCTVPPGWIESMVGCFEPAVAFVAGPVLESPSSAIASKLQALEFLGLITTAAGLIGARKPIICNGANIGYRKSAFELVDGYGIHSSSCDDETLMQRIVLRNTGEVIFNSDPAATVLTSTPAKLSEFWRQRTRWAAKRGRYEDPSILRRLLLLYSVFVVFFVAGAAALVEPTIMIPFACALIIKGLVEFNVLSAGARAFGAKVPVGYFLIAELFHVPYIAIAGMIGQISSIRWKERDLDR